LFDVKKKRKLKITSILVQEITFYVRNCFGFINWNKTWRRRRRFRWRRL